MSKDEKPMRPRLLVVARGLESLQNTLERMLEQVERHAVDLQGVTDSLPTSAGRCPPYLPVRITRVQKITVCPRDSRYATVTIDPMPPFKLARSYATLLLLLAQDHPATPSRPAASLELGLSPLASAEVVPFKSLADLLDLWAKQTGRTSSRGAMVTRIWRLRSQLETHLGSHDLIEMSPKLGYRLRIIRGGANRPPLPGATPTRAILGSA